MFVSDTTNDNPQSQVYPQFEKDLPPPQMTTTILSSFQTSLDSHYDQIFHIRGGWGKFAKCYQERGYLPALEPPKEVSVEENDFALDPTNILNEINMLRGQVAYLQHKLNEHLSTSRARPKKQAKQFDGIPL